MTWSNFSFPDVKSPLMEQLILLHSYTFIIASLVTMFLIYILLTDLSNKLCNRFYIEEQTLELTWTTLPMTVLLLIALSSFNLLYLSDEITNPSLTMKIIGHQWHWSYEYPNLQNTEVNSYMKPFMKSWMSNYRLLDQMNNNQMNLPLQTSIRAVLSSDNVLHSWTIPSLGIKIEAIPGRLNQVGLLLERPGTYYGQCSELCGINHSSMPICIQSMTLSAFLTSMKLN